MADVIRNRGSRELILPEGPDDHQGIINYSETIIDRNRAYRLDIERQALRNVLFYLGLQWIRFDPQLRTWRPLALKRTTPRPITNKLAAIVNHVCSQLQGFKPPITVGPGSTEAVDIEAATADLTNTYSVG